ncbi:MAG: hypothetical protein QOJ73_5932 [Streptosporangiaceae bacterium]|nr:hypothetical protein [Streptosporangiaceae bacterium]
MTAQLTTDLHGDVLRPGDPDYDAARAVFNAMIDRKPLAILRCREAADIAHGITFAARMTSRSRSAAVDTTSRATRSVTAASCSTYPP